VNLPEVRLGTDAVSDEALRIAPDHRPRGLMVAGLPGTGKSSLLLSVAVQDITAGAALLYVDRHDGIDKLLPHIPRARWDDVTILSLRSAKAPLWPVLQQARSDDEQLVQADLLVHMWRAQYGETSIGPRAKSILAHALMSMPRSYGISPMELYAVMTNRAFREFRLTSHPEIGGTSFGLKLFWDSLAAAGEPRIQEYGHPIINKLYPLVMQEWLKRATCGVPVPGARGIALPPQALWDRDRTPPITHVTWVGDGVLMARFAGDTEAYGLIQFTDELDRYLLRYAAGGVVRSEATSGRMATGPTAVDWDDVALRMPTDEEIRETGSSLMEREIRARRQRRAWRRCAQLELRPRGISAKEAVDIAALLDQGGIVLVEVPEVFGEDVTTTVAMFAMLAAVMRGRRQIALPSDRRVPCTVVVDEATPLIPAGAVDLLAEQRKAGVCLVLATQLLGLASGETSGPPADILDLVGTLVVLPVGRLEVTAAAALLNVTADQLRELGRGEAFVKGLTRRWQEDSARRMKFCPTEPGTTDVSRSLRELSEERHYQLGVEADQVIRQRVNRILRAAAGTTGKRSGSQDRRRG